RDVETPGWQLRRQGALAGNARAAAHRVLDEGADTLVLFAVDDRTTIRIHGLRPGAQAAEPVGDAFDHLVVDVALHQQARARRAGLARVLDDAVDDRGDGAVQ